MKRKDYLKPSILMVTIMQRTCILIGSEDPQNYNAGLRNYNRKEEEDW